MSYYNRKSSSDIGDDNVFYSRKIQPASIYDSDCNINGNNNFDCNDNAKSKLSLSENGKRYSSSKSSVRSRKSKLIEAMAANFEKKNSDDQLMKNSSRRGMPNGDLKTSPTVIEPSSVVINNHKKSPSEEVSSPDNKKASSTSKHGKSQRGKRMIRQKRRSTGVVNKEDLDELDGINSTEAEKNLQRQTDDNTHTNELSPEVVSQTPERLSPSSRTYINNRTDVDSSSPNPIQDTPKRLNGVEQTPERNQAPPEIKELRAKLAAAEITITRLRQEIKLMDQELHILEDENDQLKQDNKMLEDENRTMLRIIRN